MSGQLGNYLELVQTAREKRLEITYSQEKELRGLYEEIARELENSLKQHSSKTLTYRWLKDYSKTLRRESKTLHQTIEKKISASILQTAMAVADAERKFYTKACPALSERFSHVFSNIPVQVAAELMSGGIYRDFSGLSERIWQYEKQFNRDIQTIISRGILAQKNAYDLAKDLEIYLRPEARKPWDWGNVYPGVHRQVDYNAQRLARTAVTHAYQLSLERATKDNPFVEGYRWHSSNGGRVCPLCRERDGRFYEKGSLPLDHPNGMCVVTAEISKSYEEIGRELGDWAAGKNQNPALEKWLNKVSSMQDINLDPLPITAQSIASVKKFSCRILSSTLQTKLQNEHKKLLISVSSKPLGTEAGATYDLSMRVLHTVIGEDSAGKVFIPQEDIPHVAIHTHPTGGTFTHTDLQLFARRGNLKMLTAVGNDGTVYAVEKKDAFSLLEFQRYWEKVKNTHPDYLEDPAEYAACIQDLLKGADHYGVWYYIAGT